MNTPRKIPLVLAGAATACVLSLLWLRGPGDSPPEGAAPGAAPVSERDERVRGSIPRSDVPAAGPTTRADSIRVPGLGPEGLPPEVLAAARGEPDGARVQEGPSVPLEIRTDRPGEAASALRREEPGRGGAGAGSPSPESDAARGISRLERERRSLWTDRQRRRNALRVQVLTTELRLSAEDAHLLAEALETATVERTRLYESLDPERLDEAALAAGLDQIRADEARGLQEALGPAGLETYRRMESEGSFVLPDEVKQPR